MIFGIDMFGHSEFSTVDFTDRKIWTEICKAKTTWVDMPADLATLEDCKDAD